MICCKLVIDVADRSSMRVCRFQGGLLTSDPSLLGSRLKAMVEILWDVLWDKVGLAPKKMEAGKLAQLSESGAVPLAGAP